ncbi:MAG TPA: TadE/TadG family type IV pilus assembly protein [Sphingopyxis sp.]|jgi:hypothetical protein|uniref:TadE/TadG family type IV pilus assembly protein n=1 Tax=Sphingopyxis sp. TaxID=1908224 RepID=UPI002E144BAE|nr:TadE/TadG family type IV pilus assembly protein [Sphingopyxis sp.]
MIRRLIINRRGLARDRRGTAMVEFALTAPVFLLLLLGIIDYGWKFYAQHVLQGAVSNAARAATLEGNALNQAGLDASVREKVLVVFKDAQVSFSRKAYESYDAIGRPEPWVEKLPANGVRDANECFTDLNNNNRYDDDRGLEGNGGAEDVVLYTVSMTFTNVLPVWRMLGQSDQTTLRSTTVLRNQPYNNNTETSRPICP